MIPNDWKKIENKYFSFYVPNDMKGEQGIGLDSFNGEFKNRTIYLHFSAPSYGADLKSIFSNKLRIKKIKISGEKAEFAAANVVIEKISFSAAGVFIRDRYLLISAISRKKSDLEKLKLIMKSIRLKKKTK